LDIEKIIQAIRTHKVRITNHADDEAESDSLTFDEIFYSVMQGEIIEEYPTDFPYPSCLIYGNTFKEEPIHSVWGIMRKVSGQF